MGRLRGFEVTLFERSKTIGGALQLAKAPPFKEELANIIDYYEGEMTRLAVDLRSGRSPTVDDVTSLSPTAVILATGAKPYIPPIPGVEGPHVFHANRVLAGEVHVGPEVAVIGGAEVGCETAEYLLDQGAKVTIMRRKTELAEDVEPVTRNALLERLEKKGMKILLGVRYEKIQSDGVIVLDPDGVERKIKANYVVLATGYRSESDLLQPLQEKGLRVLPIGDARKVGRIIDAIHEANLTVRRI